MTNSLRIDKQLEQETKDQSYVTDILYEMYIVYAKYKMQNMYLTDYVLDSYYSPSS